MKNAFDDVYKRLITEIAQYSLTGKNFNDVNLTVDGSAGSASPKQDSDDAETKGNSGRKHIEYKLFIAEGDDYLNHSFTEVDRDMFSPNGVSFNWPAFSTLTDGKTFSDFVYRLWKACTAKANEWIRKNEPYHSYEDRYDTVYRLENPTLFVDGKKRGVTCSAYGDTLSTWINTNSIVAINEGNPYVFWKAPKSDYNGPWIYYKLYFKFV